MPQASLNPTLDVFRQALYFFDESQLKRFIRIGLGLVWEPEGEVPLVSQLQILAADWLCQFDFVSEAMRQEIARRCTDCLKQFADDLERVEDHKYPVFKLFIADYRWVSCTFRAQHYDMMDGEEVDELPQSAAVTYFVCDLTASYLRTCVRMTRIKRGMEAHGQDGGKTA